MSKHNDDQGKNIDRLTKLLDGGFIRDTLPLAPGDKRPIDHGWQDRSYGREELIERVGAGANVGMRLDRLVVIDVEHSDAADAIRDYIRKRHPDAPMRYRPGSSSCAFVFAKAEKDIAGWKIQRPDGVDGDHALLAEILTGHGRQLHVLGPRSDKGGVDLEWTDFPSLIDLPSLTQDDVRTIGAHTIDLLRSRGIECRLTNSARPASLSSGAGHAEQMPQALLEEALSNIENDDAFLTRDAWVEMGHAIFGASAGADWGKDLWIDWSNKIDQKPGEPERVWNSFSLDTCRTGAGFIRKQLELRGNTALHDAARQQAAVALLDDDLPPMDPNAQPSQEKQSENLLAQLKAHLPPYAAPYQAKEKFDARPFEADRTDELLIRPTILPQFNRDVMTMIAAKPSAGKSAFMINVALSIAYETDKLLGWGVPDWTGDVVFVSNEDSRAEIRRRILATESYFNLNPKDKKHEIHIVAGSDIKLVQMQNNTMRRSYAQLLKHMLGVAENKEIAMVVIDTFSSAMSGVNENDAGQMQQVMDYLNEFARAAFASFAVLHHTSKSGASSEDDDLYASRGSTAIVGAFRAQVLLSGPHTSDVDRFGWNEEQTKQIVRIGHSKANYDARRAGAMGFLQWHTVNLTATDPRTGEFVPQRVGVLAPIQPQDLTNDVARLNLYADQIADAIARNGAVRLSQRANLPGSITLGEALGVNDKQSKAILGALIQRGLVRKTSVRNPSRNNVEVLEVVQQEGAKADGSSPF